MGQLLYLELIVFLINLSAMGAWRFIIEDLYDSLKLYMTIRVIRSYFRKERILQTNGWVSPEMALFLF